MTPRFRLMTALSEHKIKCGGATCPPNQACQSGLTAIQDSNGHWHFTCPCQ